MPPKLLLFVCFAFILLFVGNSGFGQCIDATQRVYANHNGFSRNGGNTITGRPTITSINNAINGNLSNYATISVPLLSNYGQLFLEFTNGTNYINADSTIKIKLGLPATLLSAFPTITIQAFTNLTGTNPSNSATPVGSSKTIPSSLINIASGEAIFEVNLKPGASYQGVSIKLNIGVSLASQLNIYEAYILEPVTPPTSIDCNTPIDVLYGVTGGLLSGLNGVDPDSVYNAIDGNTSSSSTLKTNIGVGNEVFETVIFNTLSQPGDSLQVIFQKTGGALLDLSLLTDFTIQAYNGDIAVGLPLNNSSTGLALSLLSGADATAIYSLKAAIPGAFDRITISKKGIASVASTIKIYEVSRSMPTPKPLANGSPNETAICAGDSVTLSLNSTQDCSTYKWYAQDGTTLLKTGTSYTIDNLSASTTYYVEATRSNACNDASGRIPVTVTVNPSPDISINNPSVCQDFGSAILNVTNNNTAVLATYSIVWDAAAHTAGFTDVSNAAYPSNGQISFTVPVNTAAADYHGTITVKSDTGCEKPEDFTLTVKPEPLAPNVNITTNSQYY